MSASLDEIVNVLQNDQALSAIVYNEMCHCLDVKGELPWKRAYAGWRNSDMAYLELYIEQEYGICVPMKWRELLEGFYSANKSYHPIKKYLESLQWDGTERAEKIMVDYLGAEDSEYVRKVTRKTLIAAVYRVYQPGIKFDNMLVLCGPQGIGKSTLWKKLAKNWYSNSIAISDMKDKTAAEKLQGVWFMEVSELAGIKKVDVEIVKSFLSRADDQYRPPYAQYVESHPRSGIIVGTTNSTNGFLRDITGNRRFWPVVTSEHRKKSVWDLNETIIDQIWAEVFEMFLSGEELFLDEGMEMAALKVQRDMMEEDVRQGIIEEYLEVFLPENWNNLSPIERKTYLSSIRNDVNRPEGYAKRKKVCLLEIWCECLGREREDMKKSDAYEIEGILHQIGGWGVYRGNTSGKTRVPGYGVQRTFVRTEGDEL